MPSNRRAGLRPGFTLVELMVVMAIIGCLRLFAVLLYDQNMIRARSSDILVRYDAARLSAADDMRHPSTRFPGCFFEGIVVDNIKLKRAKSTATDYFLAMFISL